MRGEVRVKEIALMLWGLWDRIYYTFSRLQFVSKEDNLFRIVRKKYRGVPLQTKSGQWIHKGDEIIKLHIYNYRLAKEINKHGTEVSMGLYMKREIEKSMIGLSEFLASQPDIKKVKAIVGTSMLNRGAERLGFALQEVSPSWYFRYKSFLFKIIYLLVHPFGYAYLKQHGKRLQSKHMIMSIDELFDLYLDRSR